MTENTADPSLCGWEDTTTDEPCQNEVADPSSYCHLHGPDGEIPDGHGGREGNSGGQPGQSGPPGNENAVGNAGGGPPLGNQNALSTGLHSDPVNLFEWLLEEDRDAAVWILNKLHDYARDAPRAVYRTEVRPESVDSYQDIQTNLTAYGDDVLLLCVRDYARWRGTKQQLKDGLLKTTEKATDAGAVTVEDSNPVNLDLDRMDKTTTRQKDKLGLLPDGKHEEDDETVTIAKVMQEELQ